MIRSLPVRRSPMTWASIPMRSGRRAKAVRSDGQAAIAAEPPEELVVPLGDLVPVVVVAGPVLGLLAEGLRLLRMRLGPPDLIRQAAGLAPRPEQAGA